MTTERYDVLAVGPTGYVTIYERDWPEGPAKRLADNLMKSGKRRRTSYFYTVVPTGTCKDGDHYPKEEA